MGCISSPRRVVLGRRSCDVGGVVCDAWGGRVCISDGLLEVVEYVSVAGLSPGAMYEVVLAYLCSPGVYHRPPLRESLYEGPHLCGGVSECMDELAVCWVMCVLVMCDGTVVMLGVWRGCA